MYDGVELINGYLVCEACGGSCRVNTHKYDDVMHKEGCMRRKLLDILEKYRTVRFLHLGASNCRLFKRSLNGGHAARNCPAINDLLGVLPSGVLYLAPSLMCEYNCSDLLEPYEEEVLLMAEELEAAGF